MIAKRRATDAEYEALADSYAVTPPGADEVISVELNPALSGKGYAYRAEWSPEDNEYVGLVAEFPSLSWLAPTAAEAIAGVTQLVNDVLADMADTGEASPRSDRA